MEDFAAWKEKDDFQSRRLSIIDFSSEDDSLLGSAPGFLQDDASSVSQGQGSVDLFEPIVDNKLEELFEPVDANKLQEIPETDEFVPQPSKCLEPEIIRKNVKYNLRKSLAWDSAFFTCEGVLDAEELSSMISVEKTQKRMLPGIQEEVHRSSDSISSLGSDTLTLESVESSLFEDVRASIQRSRKPDKMTGESIKVVSGVREAKVGNGLKKVEIASQPKLKPKVAAKKPSISMQNPGKLPRPIRVCPPLSQSVAASVESISSVLKRPKVVDKPIPSSTRVAKRASLSGDLLKIEKDNTKVVAGRGAPVPKLPGSLRNVPRPSKSSSLAASSATITGPTSSIDSSGSTSSSVKSGKSPSNLMKRTSSRTGNPTNSSRSNPKTPSRIVSGDNIESGKSCLSAQLMPSPKVSASISPASSVSDWSTESVSSISSTQQISCSSRDSLSRSYSSTRVPMDFDTVQCVDHDEKSSAGSASRASGQATMKASAGMVALPPTSKPSGLRFPSPKLGFFDGVKSAVRTPKRQSNPVAPSNLPKAGASAGSMSPWGSGIKSKLGKVNLEVKSCPATVGAKPDAQPSFSNTKPKISFSQEASKAAAKEVKICPATSPLFKIDQEDYSKVNAGLLNKDIGFSENNGTPVILKAGEDVQITDPSVLSSVSDFKNAKCSEESAKDASHVGAEVKNEKASSDSEDQINCLIGQFGAMEIEGTEGMLFGDDTPTSYQNMGGEDNLSCKRIPFSAKDSLCNIGVSFDVMKESTAVSEGEKNSPLPPPTFSEEYFDTEQVS